VNGLPIDMRVFGDAPEATPVLVMGGIHGNETSSIDVASKLIELLEKDPQLIGDHKVTIIRIANPDGFAAGKRVNGHGVDLNRNFPATNFKSSPRFGNAPQSEPETRAILKALDALRPRLLISIHSIDKGRQCNNYDGPAEDIARRMSQHNGYPTVATIGYATPGSLGSYAGIDRQIPMITLELPRDLSSEAAWQQNREALLEAIHAAR